MELIEGGQFETADAVAAEITEVWSRDNAFGQLVTALVEVRQFKRARVVARKITVDWSRDNAFGRLVTALIEGRQFETAGAVAEEIDCGLVARQCPRAVGHSAR